MEKRVPLEVEATRVQIWLSRDLMPSRPAWLVATRTRGPKPERKYFLAECSWRTSLQEILRAAFSRWSIEQCFEQGKQELGMDQYETRSWAGWHHHMTLVILAHHFLVLERGKRGKKAQGFTVEEIARVLRVLLEPAHGRLQRLCEHIRYRIRERRQARESHYRQAKRRKRRREAG